MIVAVSQGKEKIVEILLKKGANSDIKNNNGDTALIVAAMRSTISIVRLLLENDVNFNKINIKDRFEKTALMHAIYKKNIEIVKLLLAKGAKLPLYQFHEIDSVLIKEILLAYAMFDEEVLSADLFYDAAQDYDVIFRTFHALLLKVDSTTKLKELAKYLQKNKVIPELLRNSLEKVINEKLQPLYPKLNVSYKRRIKSKRYTAR